MAAIESHSAAAKSKEFNEQGSYKGGGGDASTAGKNRLL